MIILYIVPSLADLIRDTGISDGQLDTMIPTDTIHIFAGCFDEYNNYKDILELTNLEQGELKQVKVLEGSQSAMRETLKIWRGHNPETATHREILKIVMKLGKQQVARNICKYIKENEPKAKSIH